MSERINVAILFGGQSAEHEISILSARNVAAALNPARYQVSAVYINKVGQWYYLADSASWLSVHPQALIACGDIPELLLRPGQPRCPWIIIGNEQSMPVVDCVIPMLHGTLGEDGAPQGLLEMLGIPYVGSGVLGSALCINKHVTKQLLRTAGIATADWLLAVDQRPLPDFEMTTKRLGLPLFVKPAALGSSVGASKVFNQKQYQQALAEALRYCDMVLIEAYIQGREIECAILGNELPQVTLPGEIIPHDEFYTYAAKYLIPEGKGATLVAPAELDSALVPRFQQIALQAFQVLQCKGMARVDFFLTDQSEILVNEVNTIPGFTNISMYPRLWQLSGLSYAELLDQLIELALRQHQHTLIRMYNPQLSSCFDGDVV